MRSSRFRSPPPSIATAAAPAPPPVTKAIEQDLIEIFSAEDVPQLSEEWLRLHLALPTASVFKVILASGRDGEDSLTRKKLMYQFAGEIFTNSTRESFDSEAMRRGRAMESEAISHYEFLNGCEVQRVGFVRRKIRDPLMVKPLVVGASPDGLVGDDRIIEIKTMRPDLMIELVESGRFPTEHRAQCQGAMWVTGRSVCDLFVYYSGMPISPTFTIKRDEQYIATLRNEIERFMFELDDLVRRMRGRRP